ncbi:MAG: Trk system potassium transporter TrkA [Clostridiales Family XIII bacterium]|jgi:trk system potassium uptake protein TrkA|nr:Trk system potassium transporter TrkA [Clostridiales Family XIII bacterium]
MKIAVAGAGKLGIKITEMLLSGDHSVTVIDKDQDILQKLSASLDIMTVKGNAKQISLLRGIDIGTFDFLIATTDRDEKNIVIASFAKKLGCGRVIARIRDPEHSGQQDFIKETMNIDFLVNPEFAVTQEIYKYLVEKYSINNGIISTGQAAMIEFMSDRLPDLIGKTIREIPAMLGRVIVVAISRNGKVIIPHGDAVVLAEDILYVVGIKDMVRSLNKKVHEKGKYTDIRKVMIAGGGKVGLYLARLLLEFGIAVKIIEIDKQRCQYLSSNLENALVLHGDATDVSLLEEEGFAETDAFVSATGYDEENLLLALMAKQRGIEDVIAKISRESYYGLIESMGIDMVMNPVDISAGYMLRIIQGSELIVLSKLIQGQAELIEFIADENMMLADKPISELNLPSGVIIASIHRGGKVIIPTGDTEIEEGDRVLIFCLLSEVSDLEKLLRFRRGLFG